MGKVKQRIWKAINPFFLSHRINFIADHFAYDAVIWNKKTQFVAGLDIQGFGCNVLQNFEDFSNNYNLDIDLFKALNDIGSLLDVRARNEKSASFYTSWGNEAPNGQKLKYKLDEWYKKSCTKQDSRLLQWELLLEIENMAPWENYNSFLCKIVWNIIRHKLGMTLAMIPFSQKQAFYSELLYNSNIFLNKA